MSSTRITALADVQGTALYATALCLTCLAERGDTAFFDADAVGERRDCTGNDQLECQVCGALGGEGQ